MSTKQTRKEREAARTMRIEGDSKDRAVMLARIAADPVTRAAFASSYFAGDFGFIDLSEATKVLGEQTKAVHAGDLKQAETMLVAQAYTLNAIFADLARRAALNLGQHMGAVDIYMRLALRAQSQCRTTLETLAVLKNPPVVFAKQANIAHGHQQVNNSDALTRARENPANQPTELMEHQENALQRLDTRATRDAVRGNPELASLGEIDRTPNDRREDKVQP